MFKEPRYFSYYTAYKTINRILSWILTRIISFKIGLKCNRRVWFQRDFFLLIVEWRVHVGALTFIRTTRAEVLFVLLFGLCTTAISTVVGDGATGARPSGAMLHRRRGEARISKFRRREKPATEYFQSSLRSLGAIPPSSWERHRTDRWRQTDRWVRRAYFWQSRDTILRAASEAVTSPSREKESEEKIEKERERERRKSQRRRQRIRVICMWRRGKTGEVEERYPKRIDSRCFW